MRGQLRNRFVYPSSKEPKGTPLFNIGQQVRLMGSDYYRGEVLRVWWEPCNDEPQGGRWCLSILGCYGPQSRFTLDRGED